jgi:uncharacterized OB-fold protein
MKKSKVFLEEGLVQDFDEGGRLIAGRCVSCGNIYFPQRSFCLECNNEEMSPYLLPETGDLYTFTIVNMPSAYFSPPYAIGWVKFSEGVRVFGQIDFDENTELKIGMEMRVVIGPLWEEESREIIAYKFEPVLPYGKEIK